jgi:serine/threonine-protein kinase
MSIVYLARHVMIERRSAIKILRQDLGINPVHRERFLREARAVNRINHPNIIQVTDLGEDGSLVFLVMEYFEGEPLSVAVAEGPQPAARALRISLQIASALARAHQLGVIHRDLKPENVLLRRDGDEDVVKLTDFGVAKIIDAPALTFSEQRFGTPGYIAPEYVDGEPAGPRGDLYALGVVLYALLTRTLPHDAHTASELLVKQLREEPIPPSARVDGIPPEVEALVMRLIARRPDDRPEGAIEALDALEEALLGIGGHVPARRPSDAGPREGLAHAAADVIGRWRASLDRLAARIDQTLLQRGGDDSRVRRAQDLAEVARSLLGSLERATANASEHQTRVDRLESDGMAFRSTLGHAIDSLSRERARERARPEGRHLAADLGYQIGALELQLDTRNESLDGELAQARARLEGVLAAIRRITRELARTREDAERELG